MNDFNPGPGWYPVDISNEGSPVYELARYGDQGQLIAAWNREKQVPPLPTEPYTVIRVTGRPSYDSPIFLLRPGGEWCNALDAMFLSPSDLQETITGFEVLAEPVSPDLAEVEQLLRQATDDLERVRRETAKTVIDRVRDLDGNELDATEVWDDLAREFGVLE